MNLHLFLLAGQSNMAGRGVPDARAGAAPSRVLKWTRENCWAPAVDPLHWDKPGAGVGPGKTFGEEVASTDDTITIGLVPTACGGSSIRSWVPGGYHEQTASFPYDDCLSRARAAGASGVFKAVLWHQGEGDASPENAPSYRENLSALIQRFRGELGLPELPFLVGQIGRFPGAPWNQWQEMVDAAHRHIAQTTPGVFFVSAEGLDSVGDDLHFNTESQRILGRRYAAAYLATDGSPGVGRAVGSEAGK